MSKIFEPLNPREETTQPGSELFPDLTKAPDPMVGNLRQGSMPELQSPFDWTDGVPLLTEDTREDISLVSRDLHGLDTAHIGSQGLKKDALEFKGVNWANKDGGTSRTFDNDPGFWNVDYDPLNKRGEKNGTLGVQSANVFGRQFSREELLKDDEGRRLVTLMEKQRTGELKDEGFWKGLVDFKDSSGSWRKALSDIPFFGWMVDAGSTVSETIDMSKTMRKLQNGEAVTDHEALAVRRYMLQQQLDSERGIGYTAGSVVHSSIPFMFEMAASGSMIAGSIKAGAAIGTLIAPIVGTGVGAAIGAAIGATGSFLFGGGLVLSKLFGKKAVAAGARTMLADAAKRTFEKGFTSAERLGIFSSAAEALGRTQKELISDAYGVAVNSVTAKMGRELMEKSGTFTAEQLAKATDREALDFFAGNATKAAQAEMRKRASFESTRLIAEAGGSVFTPENMSVRLASKFLVNGDVEHQVRAGFTSHLETEALRKLYPVLEDAPKDYFTRRTEIGRGLKALLEEDPSAIDKMRKEFSTGLVATFMGDKQEGAVLRAVINSMNESVGTGAMINNGYAKQVLDRMLDTSVRSAMLKYGIGEGTKHGGFVNGTKRLAQWVGDGMLDGMLRWNTSMFGGLGTIARSGSALGGKVNVLKEALKVSFIEAPVRGAMQLGMQVPLWPVAAAVTGNDPRDFVIKGQLGIQAQALQTGDRELMDHARAIAIGSGLVEYASENAGRGFNMVMGGIMKPAAFDLLPENAKDIGSSLSRKVAAVFGSEKDMIAKNAEDIADAVIARLGREAAKAGKSVSRVSRDEVLRMVRTRSAKGVTGLETTLRDLGMSESKVIRQALRDTVAKSKWKAGCLYFTAFTMMKNGWTPQKFADVLQRVGYDGIISEMAEERYGGFFQGLFGLNERPSDEGFKGRVKAMFEGLSPDKDQLITEAIGFAFPSVTHAAFNRAFSGLAQGALAGLKRDAANLNVGMNAATELNIPLASPEYVNQVNAWRNDRRALFEGRFGSTEGNEKTVAEAAADVFARVKDGTLKLNEKNKQLADCKDEGEVAKYLMEQANRMLSISNTEDQLEEELSDFDADNVYGKAVADAIRNQKNHDDSYTSKAKEEFLSSAEYKALAQAAPLPAEASGTADVDDVVNRITMAVPVLASDQSAIADIRRRANSVSGREEVRANQYRANLLDSFCKSGENIADALFRSRYGVDLSKEQTTGKKLVSLVYRGAARLVSAMDAIITGDLSLAARNPVQWALADESIDKDLAGNLLTLRENSVKAGMVKVLTENRQALLKVMAKESSAVKDTLDRIDSYDAQVSALLKVDPAGAERAKEARDAAKAELDELVKRFTKEYELTAAEGLESQLMEQFVEAGRDYFRSSLRSFMSTYLAAKNVLDVARSDLSGAALQVVADRAKRKTQTGVRSTYEYVGPDGRVATTEDFHSPEFVAATKEQVAAAEREIVQKLVQLASDNMIKVNTGSRFNVSMHTSAVIDVKRAMESGTLPEVMAAIQTLPAFAAMNTVHNLSGGNLVDERTAAAFGRTADVNELLDLPTDGYLMPGELRKVMAVLGREFALRSERENQAVAAKFLRQIHVYADSSYPADHFDTADGNKPVRVTYSRGEDADGNPVVTATVWKNGVARDTVAAPTVSGVVRALQSANVQARYRQLVFSKRTRLVSRDAVSVVLSSLSREAARDFFVARGVQNKDLPPYLRIKEGTDQWEYADVAAAMSEMRRELSAAQSRVATGEDPSVDTLRARVFGKDEYKGYETLSQEYLEKLGHRRTSLSSEGSTLLGGGQMWVVAPNALNVGNSVFVSSDYFSSGDSEALLRATLSSVIDNLYRSPEGIGSGASAVSHAEVADICRLATEVFDDAVDELATSFEALHPEHADRLRRLKESFAATPGRISVEKLAAIVSSVGMFTSERGLGEAGNGFLSSPELALVADKIRSDYPHVIPFLSVVDRALGGNGAFSGKGQPFAALHRLADAFAPTGDAILNSRKTSLFNRTGVDAAKKPGIQVPVLVPGNVTVAEGGRLVMDLGGFEFVDVEAHAGGGHFNGAHTALSTTGDSCEALRAQYVAQGCGTDLSEGDVHRMLLRASDLGGDTKASVILGRTGGARNARRIAGGVAAQTSDPGSRPVTSERISETDAVMLGRNLAFLVSVDSENPEVAEARLADRRAAMRGELSELDGRRVGSDPETQKAVRTFLQSRGMDADSIDTVIRLLPVALGGKTKETDFLGNDVDIADEENGQEQDEINDAVDDGKNTESYMDAKKIDDATGNKDLMEIGRWLLHIFPKDKRNYMAAFARTYSEVSRLAKQELDESASDGDKALFDNFRKVAAALNVLRERADKDATEAIANAERFEDEDLTQYRLVRAVEWLNRQGHPETAFVLNALRRISKPNRRAKALENMAYFSRVDVEASYVTTGADGTSMEGRRIGTGATGCEDSMRAVLSHLALSPGLSITSGDEAQSTFKELQTVLRPWKGWTKEWRAQYSWLTDILAENKDEAPRGIEDQLVGLFADDATGPLDITPEIHGFVCEFANALARRLRSVADAIDALASPGNEITAALRSPDIVHEIVSDIEHELVTPKAEGQETAKYVERRRNALGNFANLYRDSFSRWEADRHDPSRHYYHTCALIESLVLDPLNVAVRIAAENDSEETFQQKIVSAIVETDLVTVASRGVLKSPPFMLDKPYDLMSVVRVSAAGNPLVSPGSSFGAVSRLFKLYEKGSARSTARVSGHTSDQFRDSGQVNACPASPPVFQSRLEDTLLNAIPGLDFDGEVNDSVTARDLYFDNGGRFADGTRLVVSSAGVAVDGEIQEGQVVPRVVFQTNVGKYVDNGDTRNFLFQLYHGEKPTVNSVQLPGYVCEYVYSEILKGREGADFVKNRVTESDGFVESLEKAKLCEIKDPAARRRAYDALFSVVSRFSGCSEIDSKRVQVLLSQGTPFAGHRDFYSMVETDADGNETEVVHRWQDLKTGKDADKDPVVPATHFVINISGASATENLGMYFGHGRIVEAQRSISTNPDAVSFKNHLTDWVGTSLTKGQCHDIGIGLDETEDIPVTGVMREAQRSMRRELERMMGIPAKSLDMLDKAVRDAAKTGDASAQAKVDARNALVARAKEFLKFSSLVSTDMETQKSGPFGSRTGFFAESASDAVTVELPSGTFMMKANPKGEEIKVSADGGETWQDWPSDMPMPEYKNRAWPLALVIPCAMKVLKIDELKEEEVAEIKSVFVNSAGERHRSKLSGADIFESLGTKSGDRLSFVRSETAGYQVRYATRSTIGQIMANADAKSRSTNDHPAATNYVRDLVANQQYRSELDPETSVAAIATVARAVPQCVLRAFPELLAEHIEADPDTARKLAMHPYSDSMREQRARKSNSIFAKSMRIYPSATHAVMLGCGRSCHFNSALDRYAHTARIDEGAGVTAYDVDATRNAHIVTQAVSDAFRGLYGEQYAFDRTYASGLVNVDVSADGDPAFRYGWHLSDEALESSRSEIKKALSEILIGGYGENGAALTLESKRDTYLKTLKVAYPSEDGNELGKVAAVAALVWAMRRNLGGVSSIVGKIFTDYTGKTLENSAACDLEKVGLSDLFVNGEVDLMAFEFGRYRKTSAEEEPSKTIYLGGSFFSGDRRPSGNFEAACGLARAQAPVTMTVDGLPGRTAMYVLDPVKSEVQGSDTDGDSATLTKLNGHMPTVDDENFVREVFRHFNAISSSRDAEGKQTRKAKLDRNEAEKFVKAFSADPRFSDFFMKRTVVTKGGKREVTDVSEKFQRTLGNLLFKAQIEDYRMIQTRELTSKPGKAVRTGTEIASASESEVFDVGFSGRDPVGPDVVFGERVESGLAKSLYREICGEDMPAGMKYNKAFKTCINAISKAAGIDLDLDLLDAEKSAFLSGSAADANGARGVMVALQACLEHLSGYAPWDDNIVQVCPALFATYEDESGRVVYDPMREFVAHLDGISNSLFDVVKDLFAPRCGWQKNMLNYLVASLVDSAQQDYDAKGIDARFDNEWFFVRLVTFARDFMTRDNSVAGLLKKANEGNNYALSEKFGTKKPVKTLRGIASDFARSDSGSAAVAFAAHVVAPKRYRDCRNMAEAFAQVCADGSYGFEHRLLGWFRDLARGLQNEASAKALGNLAFQHQLPEGIQKSVDAIVDAAKPETEYDVMAAYREAVKSLGQTVGAAAYTGGSAESGCAVAGYMLLCDASEFQDRHGKTKRMIGAFERLEKMQTLNAAVSPEPVFQKSGSKATSAAKKMQEAMSIVSADNDIFGVQAFINANRVSDQLADFDASRVSAEIANARGTMELVAPNRAAYDFMCGVSTDRTTSALDRIMPLMLTEHDVRLYGAALMRNAFRAKPGMVDANRRMMGPMLYAIECGVDSSAAITGDRETARERYFALVNAFLHRFAVGKNSRARLDAEREKARKGNRKTLKQLEEEALRGVSDYDEDADDTVKNASQKATSVLGAVVLESLVRVGQSRADFFLQHINVTESNGNVALESKLGPAAAEMLREGFAELCADRTPVEGFYFTANGTRYQLLRCDVARLLQLHLCSTQAFDSVRENDTRVDLSCMFSTKALQEMERYGYAAEKSFVGRALMRVEQFHGGYDLLRLPRQWEDVPEWFPKLVGTITRGTPCQLAKSADAVSLTRLLEPAKAVSPSEHGETSRYTPFGIMLEAVTRNSSLQAKRSQVVAKEAADRQSRVDRGLPEVPVNDEMTVVSSFATQLYTGENIEDLDLLHEGEYATHAPFKFIGKDGEEFVTFEAAINSYASDAADTVADILVAEGVLDPSETDLTADQNYLYSRRYSQFRAAKSYADAKGNVVDNEFTLSALAATVMADTRGNLNDDALLGKWAKQALSRGGRYAMRPQVVDAIRETVKQLNDELNPEEAPKARVVLDLGSPVTARMTRAGFSEFLRKERGEDMENVFGSGSKVGNIRYALETAFGKTDGTKPGVIVTQVKRKDAATKQFVPMSLARVDRYIRITENGTAKLLKVTSYVSYGDALDMPKADQAYLDSLLEAINAEAKTPMTMEQLKGLTETQLENLVRATGARVAGLSTGHKALTTNALLALTGIVRLGNGADYFTLFHEYFHQMIGYFRDSKVLTKEDEAKLLAAFSVNGRLDEEAAADAFADYVVGKGELGGKLLKSGFGGDIDKLFEKFHRTAMALLAGAYAEDAEGDPVFMRMMVTGDFTDLEMKNATEMSGRTQTQIENALLEGVSDFDVRTDFRKADGPEGDGDARILLALKAVTDGKGSFGDLQAALGAGKKDIVEFPAKTGTFGRDEEEAEKPERPAQTEVPAVSLVCDTSVPRGVRMQALIEAALDQFGRRSDLTDEERVAVDLLFKGVGNRNGHVSFDSYDLIVGTASRILRETCNALGVNWDSWVREWQRDGISSDYSGANPKVADLPGFGGRTVCFTEHDHRYWTQTDSGVIVYTSGTAFYGAFCEGFDARKASGGNKAKMDSWEKAGKEARDFGTMIHTVYEDTFNGVALRACPKNARERAAVIEAANIARRLMKDYDFVGAEVLVADPTAKVAGSIDLLLKNRKTGEFLMVDHKTNAFIGRKGYKGAKMKGVLSHLEDSDFNHYALQLNLYRELIRRCGRYGITADTKIGLAINHFPGFDESSRAAAVEKAVRRGEDETVVTDYEFIEIPDMNAEIKSMFDYAAEHPEIMVKSGGKRSEGVPVRPGDANVVAELAVRLAHMTIGKSVTTDADGRPVKSEMYAPELYAKVDHILGNALAGAAQDHWPLAVIQCMANARSAMYSAASDLRARADVARATDEAKAADLESAAGAYDAAVDRLQRVVDALVRGENVDKLIPPEDAIEGASQYDMLFRHVVGGVKAVLGVDGTMSYTDAGGARVALDGLDCQRAVDLAAQALGAATVIARYVDENGIGRAPVGAVPGEAGTVPEVIRRAKLMPLPKPPPRDTSVLEPDVTPQMILQSQTAWMASDLQRSFYGSNLRDIMTDSSLEAVTEETNRVANNIEYYIGADVGVGRRARLIESSTSDFGHDGKGLFEVSAANRHTVTKVAATRGYMLGLITRAAKTAGEAFTLDDVNMVNFVGQAIGAVAAGDQVLFTGFDIAVDQFERVVPYVTAMNSERLVAPDGWYNVKAVIQRVAGMPKGEARGKERPSNLDMILYRMATTLPAAVTGCTFGKDGRLDGGCRPGGLYFKVLDAYRAASKMMGKSKDGYLLRNLVTELLTADNHACTDCNGKTVFTIPVSEISAAWEGSDTMTKLENAGRRRSFLDIEYLAGLVAADAVRLNKAVSRTRFMTDGLGGAVAGHSEAGLWFEAGSGHHGLVVQAYQNAREAFNGKISDDETLKNHFSAFYETFANDNTRSWLGSKVTQVVSKVTGSNGAVVKAVERAFHRDDSGRLVFLRSNKLQTLFKLLGLGRRLDDKAAIDEFVSEVEQGKYSRKNPENDTGLDINADTTVAELDRQMFELSCGLLVQERLNGGRGNTALTRAESEGGFGFGTQDLIDLNEVLRRIAAKTLVDSSNEKKVSGVVNSMSETMVFKMFGVLGSSKTGTERLRSMAESIVTAERFRGCLVQMLTTVSSDGMPNYIPMPTKGAEQLAPDAFWGALAKFSIDKLSGPFNVKGFLYDDYKSGIDNMRDFATIVQKSIKEDRDNGKRETSRMRYHSVPPDTFSGDGLFDAMYVIGDLADDDVSVMNLTSGGEAEGYLKQLFSVISSPSVWHGWKVIDRMMSYSKAMSVGMSAFFAFATRFESHVAACGLMNGVMGQTQAGAKILRKLAETGFGRMFSETMKKMGLEGIDAKMPLLSDFMSVITSDDPMVRDMREMCHLAGIPLSEAIRNPMNDAGGYIDSDIRRIKRMLEAGGHFKIAKEVDGVLRAALVNPGEYAFANVLNCVQMAVVAQTMYRLRRECEEADRPFDPVNELRKLAPYLSTEIGGIRPERYSWITPSMQRILRMGMFSWQWTMSAWTAGSGEVISDMIFGGHNTTKEMRRYAFIRWMRMLGWVKVGVPVVLQGVIRTLATLIQRTGLVGDPDDPDDRDPLGIEKMPWLCFDNESQIGAFAFDVTPLLKLCGRLRRGFNGAVEGTGYADYVAPVVPWITALGGAALGARVTRSVGGGLIGLGAGVAANSLFPRYDDVGHGSNRSGRRRYYMHFGKQSDEFWRWFTDAWTQATSKLSIPTQKVIEAFWGSVNGSNFNKAFHDKALLERFFNTVSLSPNDNALVNFLTAFTPFSCASIAQHPDAGVLGMFAPVKMGVAMTTAQKRIVERLKDFAYDDSSVDVWASSRNHRNLKLLCIDILKEAELNGIDPKEVLTSAVAEVSKGCYISLFDALPKTADDVVDGEKAARSLRALNRINGKLLSVLQSLRKQYKNANVDWRKQKNAAVRNAVKRFVSETRRSPWTTQEEAEESFRRVFDMYTDKSVRQAGKGGDALASFLATDKVPETLFGIPVVTKDYKPEDLEFFRQTPEAGGFYDMEEDGNGGPEGGGDAPPPGPEAQPPSGDLVPRAAEKGDMSANAAYDGGDTFADRANAAIGETLDFLRSHEGFSKDAYLDTEGVPTIGYGQTNIANRAVALTDKGMSEEEAARWMEGRVRENAVNLYKRHPWMQKLSTGALAAAYDLAYNMGDGIFTKANSPGFNDRLKAGEDPEKVFWSELPSYVGGKDASQKTRKGLRNRRNDAIKRWKK